MNALLQLSQPVLKSINNNLKPSYMTSMQQAVATPKQVADTNSKAADSIPEDELYAILWDNVYTGR